MSTYKRGKRWCYYIRIKGTRYRGTIPEARTKYQAQQAETRIRNQIFEGKYGTFQSNKTLRALVEKDFLPWARENKRSWRNDFSRIKPLLAFFGSQKLADISSFLIEKYKIKRSKTITMRGTKRSQTTVNRELQLLSRVLSMAVSSRDLRTNPCFEIRKFKGEVRRKRYLLPGEEARLMQALVCRRGYLRLIVMIALHTGMRRGEILRLGKQDIDFCRGEIHVTKTKTDRDREVPITATLERELKSHCATLHSDFLFANPKTRLPISDIKHGFDSVCEQAGIPDFWFHDLRHTAATTSFRPVDPQYTDFSLSNWAHEREQNMWLLARNFGIASAFSLLLLPIGPQQARFEDIKVLGLDFERKSSQDFLPTVWIVVRNDSQYVTGGFRVSCGWSCPGGLTRTGFANVGGSLGPHMKSTLNPTSQSTLCDTVPAFLSVQCTLEYQGVKKQAWSGNVTMYYPSGSMTTEEDADRPGKDYRSDIELLVPRYQMCEQMCRGDAKCKAYTYKKPTQDDPRALCWLKDSIPPPRKDPCCFSGHR